MSGVGPTFKTAEYYLCRLAKISLTSFFAAAAFPATHDGEWKRQEFHLLYRHRFDEGKCSLGITFP